MDDRLTVALVVVVALGSVGAVAVGAGAVPAVVDDSPDAPAAAQASADPVPNESNGSAVGTEVSAFMESSSESTNGSVDRGMFDAAYNESDADDRDDLVRNRTETLAARLERLEAEKQRLIERRDEMNDVAYRARMSSLVTRIHELRTAINDTERKATETGVSTDELDRLRNATGNLTGPEVARIARNLSSVTPGPPPGAGPPNETGPPDDRRGPPGDNETGPQGDDEPGPPADAGNETGPPTEGNETGPPDGNGTGSPGDGVNGSGGSDSSDGSTGDDGSDGGTGSDGGDGENAPVVRTGSRGGVPAGG